MTLLNPVEKKLKSKYNLLESIYIILSFCGIEIFFSAAFFLQFFQIFYGSAPTVYFFIHYIFVCTQFYTRGQKITKT